MSYNIYYLELRLIRGIPKLASIWLSVTCTAQRRSYVKGNYDNTTLLLFSIGFFQRGKQSKHINMIPILESLKDFYASLPTKVLKQRTTPSICAQEEVVIEFYLMSL